MEVIDYESTKTKKTTKKTTEGALNVGEEFKIPEFLQVRLEKIEKDIEKLFNMYSEQLKQINNTDKCMIQIESTLNNVVAIVSELRTNINKLMEVPAKKWNTATTTVITSVITAIITAAFSYFMMKGR